MKNLLLASVFLLFSWLSNAQVDSNKIKFSASGTFMTLYDLNEVFISKVPIGNKVNIYYDKFFRSYSITFYTSEDEMVSMKLTYIKDLNNGGIRMTDKTSNVLDVYDKIAKEGIIEVHMKLDNGYALQTFEGVKRIP